MLNTLFILFLSSLFALVLSQGAGTQQTETHPKLTWKKCTSKNSCRTVNGEVVIDANWRWLHAKNGYTNCYTGNEWNTTACPNNQQCAQNCVLDGADYQGTYGIQTSGDQLSMRFVTNHQYGTNIGSRVYLMESSTKYVGFNLMGNEITFDVDVHDLPCGLNGAVYLVNMDLDGGTSRYSTNTAGAKYGTGYCDSQCPRDLKFISGQANVEGWKPSTNDQNAGVGGMGSCCAEMDLWEANSMSNAFTAHPCENPKQHICQGNNCGGTYSDVRFAGDCDPDGCDFNPYRMGVKDFYGKGMTVDTSKKITVVTQFPRGEIKQFFVQNGKKIEMPDTTWDGIQGNSLTVDLCKNTKTVFGDRDRFNEVGGMSGMTQALSQPMVLVLSLWDDHHSNMLWLDSNYPLDKDASQPGIARGPCSTSSGVPADVESQDASSTVVYSNIRFGPLDSTY